MHTTLSGKTLIRDLDSYDVVELYLLHDDEPMNRGTTEVNSICETRDISDVTEIVSWFREEYLDKKPPYHPNPIQNHSQRFFFCQIMAFLLEKEYRLSEAYALEQDEQDVISHFRKEFDIPTKQQLQGTRLPDHSSPLSEYTCSWLQLGIFEQNIMRCLFFLG
jgi:hypothetical protein